MEKKKLSIVNLAGPLGIGVSTQSDLLVRHFKDSGREVFHLKASQNSPVEIILGRLGPAKEFLDKNPNGLVINDDFFATSIIGDNQSGLHHDLLTEKYKDVFFEVQTLDHKFGLSNIFISIDDLDVCESRYNKKCALFKVPPSYDELYESKFAQSLMNFNGSIYAQNLYFHDIETSEFETILMVHCKILAYLKKNFILI